MAMTAPCDDIVLRECAMHHPYEQLEQADRDMEMLMAMASGTRQGSETDTNTNTNTNASTNTTTNTNIKQEFNLTDTAFAWSAF